MNQQPPAAAREHHFYVSIAKFLFHHPEHGIVSVLDPIRLTDAERYGLSPLILYGITVARLPIRWITFTPADQPRPFQDILLEAWSNAEGLRGRPDILRVNRHLSAACPGLVENMAKIGIRVEVADAKEKSLPGSLRSAQDASRWLLRKHDGNDLSRSGSIQDLCLYAQVDHDFRINDGHRGVHSRAVEDRIRQWLTLPMLVTTPAVPCELEWEPGPWLSSWEASLPPNQPRYFNLDGFDGGTWLATRETAPKDTLDDVWVENDDDNAGEIVNNLVACWPNLPVDIAACAGITLRELHWFTSGKAPLDQNARFDLEAVLGLEYDEFMGVYVATGPCVLMARKPRALQEIYESLSRGGDACPCEMIPCQGTADPSWRYILINTYGEPPSIVMAPRGAQITKRIPALLMNYDGICTVAPEFYRDVVATCARACKEPVANIREMTDFAKRYEAHWADCTWQPE